MIDKVYPPCRKCGEAHKFGVHNMVFGEITPLNICSKCMIFGNCVTVSQDEIVEVEEGIQKLRDLDE